MITYLSCKPSVTGVKQVFLAYNVPMCDTYDMGIEVLYDFSKSVMVTLHHWSSNPDSKAYQQRKCIHSASDEEYTGFLKVYDSKKGKYFNYNHDGIKARVYIPKDEDLLKLLKR